jgi:hypothetical protein
MDENSKKALVEAFTEAEPVKHELGVSCMDLFDAFWLCGNPGSQMKEYYKCGKYKDCTAYLSDWRRCLQLKGTSDPVKRVALVDAMSTLPELKAIGKGGAGGKLAHASAEIWQLEETPTWIKK